MGSSTRRFARPFAAASRAAFDVARNEIRGVSDVVGFKRDPDWTTYACETAAAFAHAFLRSQPIPPIARP